MEKYQSISTVIFGREGAKAQSSDTIFREKGKGRLRQDFGLGPISIVGLNFQSLGSKLHLLSAWSQILWTIHVCRQSKEALVSTLDAQGIEFDHGAGAHVPYIPALVNLSLQLKVSNEI